MVTMVVLDYTKNSRVHIPLFKPQMILCKDKDTICAQIVRKKLTL